MSAKNYGSARQMAYIERQRELDIVRVTVQVPRENAEAIRTAAKRFRELKKGEGASVPPG